MNSEHDMAHIKPTGKNYSSVDELMRGEGVSQEVQSKVMELGNETRLVLQLAKLRQKSGLTQEDIATRLEVGQSAISKLESGKDEDLTIRQIREYARATGERIAVHFGKPYTHVEATKLHALGIKLHLESLAKIANQHDELEGDIQAFFGEACYNILNILAKCGDQLPCNANQDDDVRIEIVRNCSLATASNSKPKLGQDQILA